MNITIDISKNINKTYAYVYMYTNVKVTKSNIKCNQLAVSLCAFGRVPGSWDGSETWRGKTFGGGIGSCAKALHAARRCIPWSLGITGHHWATLSQYVEQYSLQYVTTHSQFNTLKNTWWPSFRVIWTWCICAQAVYRCGLYSLSMSFMFLAGSWRAPAVSVYARSTWVRHFIDMLRYLLNPSDTVCSGDIQQARRRGG